MTSSASPQPVHIQHIPLNECRNITCLELTAGPLTLDSLTTMNEFLRQATPRDPLLLITQHATLPALNPPQEQQWILLAGQYRQAQERFKRDGGLLISLATRYLTGGTYLVHGMAARYRLAYPNTVVYPALPADTYEALFGQPYPHPSTPETALSQGIITEIIQPANLNSRLAELTATCLP